MKTVLKLLLIVICMQCTLSIFCNEQDETKKGKRDDSVEKKYPNLLEVKVSLSCNPKESIHTLGMTKYSMPTPIDDIILTVHYEDDDSKLVELRTDSEKYLWEINNCPPYFSMEEDTSSKCTFKVKKQFLIEGDIEGQVSITPVTIDSKEVRTELEPITIPFTLKPWGNISADLNNDGKIEKSHLFQPEGTADVDDYIRDDDLDKEKVTTINDDDADGDGDPDYMDGKKCLSKDEWCENFVEIKCQTSASFLEKRYFELKYDYNESNTPTKKLGTGLDNPTTYSTNGCSIRVWDKDREKLILPNKIYEQEKEGEFSLFVECVSEGVHEISLYTAKGDGSVSIGECKTIRIEAIKGKITFDIDRSESIDDMDKTLLLYGKGFHAWSRPESSKNEINGSFKLQGFSAENVNFFCENTSEKMRNDLKYESNIENNKKILNNNIDLFYKGDISMKSFGEFSAKSIAPNEAFTTQQAIATLIQTEFEKMINTQLTQPVNSTASGSMNNSYSSSIKSNESETLSEFGRLIDVFPIKFDVSEVFKNTNFKNDKTLTVTYDVTHEKLSLSWVVPDNLSDGELLKYHTDSSITAKSERLASITTYNPPSSLTKEFEPKRGTVYALFYASSPCEGLIKFNVMAPASPPAKPKFLFSVRSYVTISTVKDMMQTLNIRSGTPSRPSSFPINYPEELINNKVFLFAHGLIPGTYKEGDPSSFFSAAFKALYWSGSNARFCGVEWDSDIGLTNYYSNVISALESSEFLKSVIESSFKNKKIFIMGHSLGNMLVSNAIANHNMRVSKYFATNAAVPAEAYGSITPSEKDIDRIVLNYYDKKPNHNISVYMIEHDWINEMDNSDTPTIINKNCYHPRSWASYYHLLHQDDRSKLSWVDLFKGATPSMVNYYSSSEEVFDLKLDPWLLSGADFWVWDFSRYAWQKQEVSKGTGTATAHLSGTCYGAGWGFDRNWYMDVAYSANATHDFKTLPDSFLCVNPVFVADHNKDLFKSILADSERYKLLAEGIPALTPAAGRTSINGVVSKDILNDIIQNKNIEDWVHKGLNKKKNAWLHSDIKNLPYYFTAPFYKDIVKEGDLKSKEGAQ